MKYEAPDTRLLYNDLDEAPAQPSGVAAGLVVIYAGIVWNAGLAINVAAVFNVGVGVNVAAAALAYVAVANSKTD